jgi:hypothetical protein
VSTYIHGWNFLLARLLVGILSDGFLHNDVHVALLVFGVRLEGLFNFVRVEGNLKLKQGLFDVLFYMITIIFPTQSWETPFPNFGQPQRRGIKHQTLLHHFTDYKLITFMNFGYLDFRWLPYG